jgi:hypothetical protein
VENEKNYARAEHDMIETSGNVEIPPSTSLPLPRSITGGWTAYKLAKQSGLSSDLWGPLRKGASRLRQLKQQDDRKQHDQRNGAANSTESCVDSHPTIEAVF